MPPQRTSASTPLPLRFRPLVRTQMSFRGDSLEQLLPPDHPVRALWQLIDEWDLTVFLALMKSFVGEPGAPSFDPRVLLALWIQATLDGYGSARELEDLCRKHLVYRWICGDEPVNYHTLADFRSTRAAEIDALLTQIVAVACQSGIATIEHVSQDGVRVRANAGSKSFRREKTLTDHLAEARKQVETLKSQAEEDDGAANRRAKAAKERAAKERVDRLARAKAELEKLTKANDERAADSQTRGKAKDPAKLRVSMTDPEARRIPMAGGSYRPAYNVQFATTVTGGIIVGVNATNEANDHGQTEPMVEQILKRTGKRPKAMTLDAGYTSRDVIERLAKDEVLVYCPVKDEAKAKAVGRDPFVGRTRDKPEVAAWRVRMGTEDGKAIYKLRAQTAEWANAQCRNRGLQQLRLRGLKKVKLEAMWHALTHNVDRLLASRRSNPNGADVP